jgi:hypothetical protein
MRFDLRDPIPISQRQSIASGKVDAAAEAGRLHWITPGAGQALEYQETSAEAVRAAAAPDPLAAADYPLLAADQAAHAAAGVTLTLRQVAEQVAAQQTAWLTAATAIKQARLTAKRRIALATSQTQIDTILAGVEWPTPPAKTATEG